MASGKSKSLSKPPSGVFEEVADKDHPLWPIFEHHAGGPLGFIWSSKLASVFRLSGLLVIDSALDAAIKKVRKQHELIASVW